MIWEYKIQYRPIQKWRCSEDFHRLTQMQQNPKGFSKAQIEVIAVAMFIVATRYQ
jgi:hypothetical protein